MKESLWPQKVQLFTIVLLTFLSSALSSRAAAPVANDDSATVIEGGTVSVLDGGVTSVLANDTAFDIDSLVVNTIPVSGPSHGTLTLAADGEFTYTHDGTENFTDSFVYELSDGLNTATATVDITILPLNDNAPAITRILYSVERGTRNFRQIDPATGSTTDFRTLVGGATNIFAATGLARHPFTGQLWGLFKVSGQEGRELVTINPDTLVATGRGDTGRFFSTMAFDSRGILYGVTGDARNRGEEFPETVFRINLNDATSTFFMTLGNGNNGEALAFNPVDGLFYHASGNSPELFESVDFRSKSVTDIPLSGDIYNQATALTYDSVGNLLLTGLSRRFINLEINGVATNNGSTDHIVKGLAFTWEDTTAIQDNMTAKPFLGLTIEDVDSPALNLSVTVTLDDPAKGVLTALGGFSDDTGGVYSFNGTAEEATAAVEGLIFIPTEGRVSLGQTELTILTLTVYDGVASPVSNSKTVLTTAVENSPVLLSIPETSANSSEPYSYGLFAFDLDPAETLVITAPTLPGWVSFLDNGDGTASLTGIPTGDDVGVYNVSLVVTNSVTGNSATQDFAITVVFVNHDPILRLNIDLYSVSRDDDLLRSIDITDGSTLSSVTITVTGETVFHANGLAINPVTRELWAILATSCRHCTDPRSLAVIDPFTGVATTIGNLGDAFAGLAFDDNGTLFGVTGDGASNRDILYTLDLTDATPTFFMNLGNGSFGETIGFNPDDGLLYHGSGSTFEAIDLDQKTIIDISTSFSAHSALTYEGSGNFLLAVYDDFFRVSTSGVRTDIGFFDIDMKGLALPGPQLTTDVTTITPFLKVSLSDSDLPQQDLTVTVSLDDPAKGSLATLGGFVDQGGGVYLFTGTAAGAESAVRGLTFVPAQNRVGAGLKETTILTISADDGLADITSGSIKVITTSVNDNPTISREPALYSGDRSKNKLRVLDMANGKTIKTLTVDLDDNPVKKVDGLATHPITGELWASVTLESDNNERRLVTIDPLTGLATLIGNTGDKITGLAFDNSGVLFGVIGVGNGNFPSESLLILDQATAAPSLFLTLGNGGSGETIGFNPDNGLMYHGSGEVFESVDLSSLTVNSISSSFFNITALTYEDAGNFFMSQFSEFSRLSIIGDQTILGTLDHDAKGLAFNEYDGSGQSIGDFDSIAPFQLVTIGHTGDPPADVTVTVNQDDSAKGLLSNLGGFSIIGGGSYSFNGSPDAATTAIQSLVFQPVPKRVTLGTTETTSFTITVDDSLVTPVIDTTTSVVTTAVLESYDDWVVRVFSTSDAGDAGISGQLVDFNGDGVENLLVYTFGLDPALNNVGDLPFSTLNDTGDAVCLFFRLAKNAFQDVTITVEKSTNLTDWTTVTETPEFFSDEGDHFLIKVTVPVNSDEKLFLRLVVEDNSVIPPPP